MHRWCADTREERSSRGARGHGGAAERRRGVLLTVPEHVTGGAHAKGFQLIETNERRAYKGNTAMKRASGWHPQQPDALIVAVFKICKIYT
jgi:hypothetical protein